MGSQTLQPTKACHGFKLWPSIHFDSLSPAVHECFKMQCEISLTAARPLTHISVELCTYIILNVRSHVQTQRNPQVDSKPRFVSFGRLLPLPVGENQKARKEAGE